MYYKQVDAIVAGRKRCTQRCEHPGDVAEWRDGKITLVRGREGRLKWHVGGSYAVSPGRGQCSALVLWPTMSRPGPIVLVPKNPGDSANYRARGYQVLRIQVCQIEHVRVQSTDERVAIAEGVQSVEAYAALWRSINRLPGTRWEDDPLVWRLWFELAREAV